MNAVSREILPNAGCASALFAGELDDRPEQAPKRDGEKHVVFFLEEKPFAVSAAQIAEIIPPLRMTVLPRSPAWVLGIANLRGSIISIIDLEALRTGKPSRLKISKLLVLRGGGDGAARVAVAVSRVGELLFVSRNALTRKTETRAGELKSIECENGFIDVLDAQSFFSSLKKCG